MSEEAVVGPQVIGKSRVEKKEGAPENHCRWWVSVGVASIKGKGHPGADNDKKPTDSAEGEVDGYVRGVPSFGDPYK